MKSIKKKPIMILLMAALMATFIVGLCACGKSDSKKVACVDDLEGAKIGVQLGTTGDIYVSDYENDGSGTKVERYNKGADAVQALKVGKIDCVVIDEQPALAFVKENKGLKILDEEFTNEDYAFCLKKGNTELRDKVNTALEKLQQDGTVQSIIDNYIGSEDQVGKTPYVKKDIDRSNGTLKVGTNAEFPPYEYYEGENVVGIDADIAAAVADKLGMELKIEDMAFDSIIPAVTSGKADIGLAGMTVTEDRLENVDFSDTYAHATQVVIVKEDSDIASPDDLEGKKIGVQLGTTGDIYAGDIKDATVERYNKGFEAVQALTQDKIDAVVIDGEPAKVFVKENEGLKMLDEAFTEEDYAIAVAKGNDELLDKINTALGELKDSGELDKIVDKYITAE